MDKLSKHSDTSISAERILQACISLSPLFLLAVVFWINGIIFLSSAISVFIIIRAGIHKTDLIPAAVSRRWLFLIIAVLASPMVAVLIGQCFRQEFSWRSYDSPSRFLMCITILLAIVHCKINAVRIWNYTITAAVFSALAAVIVKPSAIWGARMTTSFVDPLTFGSLSLTLGLLSLVLINLNDTESVLVSTYKLCGCGLGIYLSIISGSRTGWPAVPAVLLIWLLLRDRKRSILSTVVAIGAPVVLSVAAYYLSPAIQQKVALTANEFLAYRWNELNPDGSIPMRISFYRMALSLFIQQPFGGWGETSFLHAVNSPEFARYATQYTREFVKNGFHNEIMTAMVQSGVWGLISRVSIFLFPAMLFIRGSRSEAVPARKIALLSCCYLVCTFISGMSTEVFNLKFTASFHAFVITCLTGSLLAAMGSSENSKLSSGVVGKSQ